MSIGEQFNANITWVQREYYEDFGIISNNTAKFQHTHKNCTSSPTAYNKTSTWRINEMSRDDSLSPASERPKRSRTVFLRAQLLELEKEFKTEVYLRHNRTVEIAKRLSLSKRQVKVWFQNRRMKENRRKEHAVNNNSKSSNTSAQGNIVQRLMSYAQADVEKKRVCEPSNVSMPVLTIPEWTVPQPSEIKTLLESV